MYEQGGCSTISTKKNLHVYFDSSAGTFDRIIFGAGENSYHVEVRLEDLKNVISYELAEWGIIRFKHFLDVLEER